MTTIKSRFYRYKSFSFHEKGLEKLEMNDLDKRRVIESVTKNLEEKGLKRVEAQADLYINILSIHKGKSKYLQQLALLGRLVRPMVGRRLGHTANS